MSHERGTPLGVHLEDESERPCWYPFGRFTDRFFRISSPGRCSHIKLPLLMYLLSSGALGGASFLD